MGPHWTNWAATASCTPAAIAAPAGEEEIVQAVRAAAAAGRRVRVAGTGHSFTDLCCTDGTLLKLDRHDRVIEVDAERRLATVQGGITIARLSEELDRHGLALPNLGDVAYQTISGAISTATHGTGERRHNIACQVAGLSLVLADGGILRSSPELDREAFEVARVGLGALGVISTVTLRCEPAFNLHSIEEPRDLDEVLEEFDELAAANDHFELFWFPHTRVAQTIRNNRTDEPARPRRRLAAYVDDILVENHVFHVVQALGRAWTGWIPRLAGFTTRLLTRSEVVERSHRVFANERLVRFAEMEYAIPRRHVVHAVREVRSMIARSGLRISFPIEVRVLDGDDIALSTAYGRETAYVAVHVFWRLPHERYFREVEAIMRDLEGRPHWGKLHFQDAESLRPRYPLWDRFGAVRDRLDPERRFTNDYLRRVLGS
ncbi:MAG TPA: D-arabinono-1,4-lactone oxidase [Candidatus Eisenbacteria bacterium]|nr:D-arabinono-1,4-lactone oxidase [Candidatus Eisenbacteria bacterium]